MTERLLALVVLAGGAVLESLHERRAARRRAFSYPELIVTITADTTAFSAAVRQASLALDVAQGRHMTLDEARDALRRIR